MISGTTITSGSNGKPMKLANPNPQIALMMAERTGRTTPCQVRKYQPRRTTIKSMVAASTV